VRNTNESFRPSVLEGFSRSEQALRSAIGEMYIQGVSTRKVSKIVEHLWPDGVSSGTVSNITKELDTHLDEFRNRPLKGRYKFIMVFLVKRVLFRLAVWHMHEESFMSLGKRKMNAY